MSSDYDKSELAKRLARMTGTDEPEQRLAEDPKVQPLHRPAAPTKAPAPESAPIPPHTPAASAVPARPVRPSQPVAVNPSNRRLLQPLSPTIAPPVAPAVSPTAAPIVAPSPLLSPAPTAQAQTSTATPPRNSTPSTKSPTESKPDKSKSANQTASDAAARPAALKGKSRAAPVASQPRSSNAADLRARFRARQIETYRVMIPTCLVSGITLPILAGMWFLLDQDAVARKLPLWVPLGVGVFGLVALALGILLVSVVRTYLHLPAKTPRSSSAQAI